MTLTWAHGLLMIALFPVIVALIMVLAHFVIKFVRAGRTGALMATVSAVILPLGVLVLSLSGWRLP